MGQTVNLKAKGVFSLSNSLSAVPEGALRDANNVVIDRDDLIESRRGFKEYGEVDSSATTIRRIIPYQDALIAHYGSALKRDEGAGVFTAYSGTFAEPATGYRVRDVQSNDNLYLTTAAGIQKLDVINGTWRAAGVPRPLDGVSSLTGGSGFLTNNTNVAYRTTLHYTDTNDNEIVSAPSQRLVVVNTAGGTRDVTSTWYLPDGMTTAYTLRTYRSEITASILDDPSDELQLVAEQALTSTDVSNGYVTVPDSTPDTLRGAFLYTSPSQPGLGIADQNDQPPFAHDVCLYKGHVLYANVRSKHRLSLLLIGAGAGSLTYVADNVATTNASPIVTSVASTTNLHVGMKVKAAAGIPSTARILTIDGANQITMTVNATATGARDVEFQDIVTVNAVEYFAASATVLADHEFLATIAGTPAENIEATALSLVFAVNQDPTNTTIYAFYTSGFEDIPGSIDFEERTIGGSAFTASSTSGDSFNPQISTAISSSNSAAENTVMASKFGQPEAVPLKNKYPAGAKPIRRILALRDSVIILSEDQIFKLVGDSNDNFVVDVVDTTTKLKGPETAVVFNDAVHCFSDQGVVKITEGNTPNILSRPIEDELQRVSSDLFADFENIAFGVGYETARRYILHIPNAADDDRPTKACVYNAFTGGWTFWDVEYTAGVVDPANDKLHYGEYDSAAVFQERKNFTRTDYADREFAVTIASSSGTTVTVASTSNVEVGYLLVQSSRESIVTRVTDATHLVVADTLTWTAGAATVYEPIDWFVDWVPNTAGNPGVTKHYSEVGVIFRDAQIAECDVSFSNNFFPTYESVTVEPLDLSGAWGQFGWGDGEWGRPDRGEQIIRTYVPLEKQRCHWLNVRLSGSEPFSNFKLAGLSIHFEEMSSRFT